MKVQLLLVIIIILQEKGYFNRKNKQKGDNFIIKNSFLEERI